MTPQQKAKEYAFEYAENMFPYDIGGDNNWNEKNALVSEVAETACLFMYEWTKEYMLKQLEVWEDYYLNKNSSKIADALDEIITWFRSPEI